MNTFVSFCLFIPPFLIFSFHLLDASIDRFFISMGFGQNTLDQFRKPITDRLFVEFRVVNRKSKIAQRLVHGIGQVLDRIEQSPVEVEYNSAMIICVRDNFSP